VLCFKNRWWETLDKPICGGTSSTDMPIRKIVYPSYGINKKNAPGILIVSYTWGQDAAKIGAMKDDTKIVELCLHNLEKIHGNIVREQYINQYKIFDWYNNYYSQGAFAFFGPGQFMSLFPELIKPAVNNKLHFAGELTSVHHAWVVGSLNSAYRSVYEILHAENLQDKKQKLKEIWGEIDEVEFD
jgi:monoamine oxidase